MSDSNVTGIFWMVWNPQGRNPTHRHETLRSARDEAARLSIANAGQRFFVLQAVDGYVMPSPGPQRIVIDDGLPF